MATTYELIESKVLSSSNASVTFTSIPQTYTDLQLSVSVRTLGNVVNDSFYLYPNASSANGSRRTIFGTGSSAGSESASDIRIDYFPGNNATSNTFGSGSIYIPNYTSSNNKSFSIEGVAEGNITAMFMVMTAGLWSNSAAITSLQLTGFNGNLAVGSSFYLYGIKNS